MAELTRLARFHLTVTKDKSTSDQAQVPADANVDFYKQGATVTNAVTVPNFVVDVSITVRDIGRIVPGDVLCRGVLSTPSVTVSSVVGRTTMIVYSNGNGDLVLSAGDRLIVTSGRPRVYRESSAVDFYPTSQVVTDGLTGALYPAYLRESFFDAIVTGSGVTERVLADQPGGLRYPVYNVKDLGGDIQTAIDALPDTGGVVYIPAGIYQITQGLVIAKDSVILQGDGLGTVIRAQTFDLIDLITVRAAHCKISNLKLDGNSPLPGTRSCLVIQGPAVPGGNIVACYLENIEAIQAPQYGLWVRDALITMVVNCSFNFNHVAGVQLDRTTFGINGTRFFNCTFNGNTGPGVVCHDAIGASFYGCDFEANTGGSGVTQGNALEAHNCERIEVYSCYIEDALTTPNQAQQFILFDNCRSAIVDSCWFQGGTTPSLQPSRAVRLTNSPWTRLTNNAYGNMPELALFDAFCRVWQPRRGRTDPPTQVHLGTKRARPRAQPGSA